MDMFILYLIHPVKIDQLSNDVYMLTGQGGNIGIYTDKFEKRFGRQKHQCRALCQNVA